MKISLIKAAILFTAGVMAVSCISDNGGDGTTDNYIKVGDQVPSFSVSNLNGEKFTSPAGFEGKTSLLVMFATWCPACRGELPSLNSLWGDISGDETLGLLLLSRAEEISVVEDFWKEAGYTVPWYPDSDRKVFDMFANQSIPRLYIIRNGRVQWMSVGSPGLDKAGYINLLNKYK